jgi:hypothetical protein
LSFWQRIKTASSKHLGLLIAGGLAIISFAALSVPYCHSNNRQEFIDSFLSNLGTEVLGMAMTIVFVERILAWRDKRDHISAVQSQARNLLRTFQSFQVAYDRYLNNPGTPPPDAIKSYGDALKQTATIATRLVTLVDEQQPELASKLASYAVDAESQSTTLENAAAAVRYAALDAAAHIERVRADGQRLLTLSNELCSQVSVVYRLSTDLGAGG